jgi:hypothetical protein
MARAAKASAYSIRRLECDPYDSRVTQRHINDARISREELAKHLQSLPDEAGQADEVRILLTEDESRRQRIYRAPASHAE